MEKSGKRIYNCTIYKYKGVGMPYEIQVLLGCVFLHLLFDVWQVIIMPIVFTWSNKRRILYVFLGNILLIVFQLLSMYIKSTDTLLVTDGGALISIIFSIDVLIMDILYYFYSNIILGKGAKNG